MNDNDEFFMRAALAEAEKAFALNEVPVGCVIVFNGEIIAAGYNMRNTKKNPLCHAEISAINAASKFINDWRLEDCSLYVTIEPCPMCAGAIVQARIKSVFYGAKNPKAGAYGSLLDMQTPRFNHRVNVVAGVCEADCAAFVQKFFSNLRNK